jgi:hypothetical protein
VCHLSHTASPRTFSVRKWEMMFVSNFMVSTKLNLTSVLHAKGRMEVNCELNLNCRGVSVS